MAIASITAKPSPKLPKPGDMSPYGRVHTTGLEERAAWLAKRSIKKGSKLRALRMAVSMCDLTTLEGADTEGKAVSICAKACEPYSPAFGMPSAEDVACPRVAAVCVYPNLVPVAVRALAAAGALYSGDDEGDSTPQPPPHLQTKTRRGSESSDKARSGGESYDKARSGIKIAAVATGFPSGQYPLSARLREVRWAVEQGAHEIDMVINRNAFLSGDYRTVYREIERTKEACGGAHLKVILETGEIGSYDAIRNASFIAMHAGADFIKTSTGKITPSATLPVTLCMLEAIRDYYDKTGIRIGMKPAGGIRTAKQAIQYLVVLNETLGEEWLTPDLFRFGASSLVNDLLAQMVKQLTGVYRSADEFSEV
jgi:deoxyribose-phosphate aldolase